MRSHLGVRREDEMTDTETPGSDLEEGAELLLDFGKMANALERSPDIIPVAVQNADSREVILVAYTNKLAFERSVQTRIATFWSTSRNELWVKGETSGHLFELVEVRVNCEQNSLLYLVRPKGDGICHTRNAEGRARNCYYRRLSPDSGLLEHLDP